MAAKKKAASGNIEARLAALRADFEALQADMKGLYGDVSEVASERAALAMPSIQAPASPRRPTRRRQRTLASWRAI